MTERRRWTSTRADEGGSIALLAPAAVLVLVVLGAIAVDLALVQGAQRRLVDLAGTVATDAVGQVDVDAALGGGELTVDRAAAQRHADRSAAALDAADARLRAVACAVDVDLAEVVVRCRADVDAVVGRAIPGAPASREVTARDAARPAG